MYTEDARTVAVEQKTSVVRGCILVSISVALVLCWSHCFIVYVIGNKPDTKYCKFCEGVDHALILLLGC